MARLSLVSSVLSVLLVSDSFKGHVPKASGLSQSGSSSQKRIVEFSKPKQLQVIQVQMLHMFSGMAGCSCWQNRIGVLLVGLCQDPSSLICLQGERYTWPIILQYGCTCDFFLVCFKCLSMFWVSHKWRFFLGQLFWAGTKLCQSGWVLV